MSDQLQPVNEDINYFDKMYGVNVNDKLEKKNGLSYLSWAWAWAEVKKIDPNAVQKTHFFPYEGNEHVQVPYLKTPNGYFVQVSVTIHGHTETEMLPVLDHRNKPIQNPNAFELNKNTKRCLVKAIAMHGLGLYVYAGDDLPESNTNTPKNKQNASSNELSVEKLQSIVKGKKVAATKKFKVSFEEVDKKILEQVPEWHGFTNKPEKLKAAKELLESWGC
ncbi:TPA: DUF1071 domain-containing protein [Bacillus cereus]